MDSDDDFVHNSKIITKKPKAVKVSTQKCCSSSTLVGTITKSTENRILNNDEKISVIDKSSLLCPISEVDTVTCPICNRSMSDLGILDQEIHINSCLDSSANSSRAVLDDKSKPVITAKIRSDNSKSKSVRRAKSKKSDFGEVTTEDEQLAIALSLSTCNVELPIIPVETHSRRRKRQDNVSSSSTVRFSNTQTQFNVLEPLIVQQTPTFSYPLQVLLPTSAIFSESDHLQLHTNSRFKDMLVSTVTLILSENPQAMKQTQRFRRGILSRFKEGDDDDEIIPAVSVDWLNMVHDCNIHSRVRLHDTDTCEWLSDLLINHHYPRSDLLALVSASSDSFLRFLSKIRLWNVSEKDGEEGQCSMWNKLQENYCQVYPYLWLRASRHLPPNSIDDARKEVVLVQQAEDDGFRRIRQKVSSLDTSFEIVENLDKDPEPVLIAQQEIEEEDDKMQRTDDVAHLPIMPDYAQMNHETLRNEMLRYGMKSSGKSRKFMVNKLTTIWNCLHDDTSLINTQEEVDNDNHKDEAENHHVGGNTLLAVSSFLTSPGKEALLQSVLMFEPITVESVSVLCKQDMGMVDHRPLWMSNKQIEAAMEKLGIFVRSEGFGKKRKRKDK